MSIDVTGDGEVMILGSSDDLNAAKAWCEDNWKSHDNLEPLEWEEAVCGRLCANITDGYYEGSYAYSIEEVKPL